MSKRVLREQLARERARLIRELGYVPEQRREESGPVKSRASKEAEEQSKKDREQLMRNATYTTMFPFF